MKKLFLILTLVLTLASHIEVRAQYYSVNIDLKTAAAMEAAYAAGAAAEIYYNDQIQDILKHYTAAEVAAAGIFSSKYLDRKALTELGIWSSATENYYYRRIYSMVSSKIMPKIWTVAGMMLRSPQNAMYWGTYLMEVCDETKSLCMQFESVVTNSTLSFSDIAFLEISSEISDLLKLSQLGGVDFKSVLDSFSQAGKHITVDNLENDISTLYSLGVGLAGAGAANLAGRVLQNSTFNDIFSGKVGAAITLVDNYSNLFQTFENGIGNAILELVGGPEAVSQLFNLSNYDMTSWIDDYARESIGQYYRQRWYIYRRDKGNQTVCLYEPSDDKESILDGPEWIRFNTTSETFSPTATQLEQVRLNSESHAGFSRKLVSELNRQGGDYTYDIYFYLRSYIIKKGSKVSKKAYAYAITGTKYWDISEVVYEEVFDSYSMDQATFQAQLQAKLASFNDNEDGIVYTIGSDSKNYYQMTDEKRIQGVETATISVTCSDGATLAEGNTQYKCGTCGSSLSSHTKECAMQTSVSESGTDTSDLESDAAKIRSDMEYAQSAINDLETENSYYLKVIRESSIDDAAVYRELYNQNLKKIEQYKSELKELDSKLREIENAIEEARQGEDVQTDDYYRIPAIMNDLQRQFSLTWKDAGSWSGYTFTRKASLPSVKGEVTFTASLSIARKPKYLLGIKIHRAIVQISWKLTSSYSDTHVVDIITLDPSASDREKADIVNRRISEIARMYPSCTISTEYAKSEPVTAEETDDRYHLLWSSDRLEIAREVDTRLTRIYSDLVSLEKMMSYKRDFIDILRDIAPYVNDNLGKTSILEQCHDRWIRNASLKDNHKEDEP